MYIIVKRNINLVYRYILFHGNNCTRLQQQKFNPHNPSKQHIPCELIQWALNSFTVKALFILVLILFISISMFWRVLFNILLQTKLFYFCRDDLVLVSWCWGVAVYCLYEISGATWPWIQELLDVNQENWCWIKKAIQIAWRWPMVETCQIACSNSMFK